MLDDPRAFEPPHAWPGRRLVRRIRRGLLERVDAPGFEKLAVALIAIWVALLLTQIVIVIWFTGAHVHHQFEAVIGLLVDLALFLMVRAVLTREIERRPPPARVPRSTDAAPSA